MIKTRISAYLEKYECPTKYKGYTYLVNILSVTIKNYVKLCTNLKSFYIDEAVKNNTTRLAIERNLRTLIDVWEKRPKFNELFEKKPTNAVLIRELTMRVFHLGGSVYDTLLFP